MFNVPSFVVVADSAETASDRCLWGVRSGLSELGVVVVFLTGPSSPRCPSHVERGAFLGGTEDAGVHHNMAVICGWHVAD